MKRYGIGFLLIWGAACSNEEPAANSALDGGATAIPVTPTAEPPALAERTVSYSEALRVASLRLRGVPPTLAEIRFLQFASSQAEVYAGMVSAWLDGTDARAAMLAFFRDTMRLGGNANLDTAPLLAVALAEEDESLLLLLTSPSGNCPRLVDGAIVREECATAVEVEAGVLTNPHVMRHFYSNLAFRRVRWVQETFACRAFPTEDAPARSSGGANPLVTPWAMTSIAGRLNGGRIDFHDTTSVVCANCHGTMNHLAPLFAFFDESGAYFPSMQVPLPLPESPIATFSDFLPPGEVTAWRDGTTTSSLAELGSAMVDDEDVQRCLVQRTHNWIMGHDDIVDGNAAVPDVVAEESLRVFRQSGFQFRALLRHLLTSSDFVRF